MNFKKYIIGIMTFTLSVSCEKILDFNGDNESNLQGITINALAVNDTIFTAAISKAYLFTEIQALHVYDDYWTYERYPEYFYEKQAIISEAEVEFSVNGSERYKMRYDSLNLNYKSDYTLKIGDKIALYVKAGDFKPVSAEAVIPTASKIEILNCEKYYDKKEMSDLTEYSAKDTVARISLRLTDSSNEHNYYRLKVRSIAYEKSSGTNEDILIFSDIYTSSDVIFMDNQLTESYGGWPAYFSNIFDDHLFNGKEYDFTVESRMRAGNSPHIVIELQTITPELYYYLKSVMLYRITDIDSYTESIQIYSNVNNGWGLLGGMGTEKHVLRL